MTQRANGAPPGRASGADEGQEVDATAIQGICCQHGDRPEALIDIFHAVQQRYGYIPTATLPHIASALNLSRADVYGVLTFYHDFRQQPPGRRVVKLCRAEACQAMGCRALEAHAKARLGIDYGETTADGAITLEPVYCLGNCALSPAMMIDDALWGRVDAARFDELLGISEPNCSLGQRAL